MHGDFQATRESEVVIEVRLAGIVETRIREEGGQEDGRDNSKDK